MNRKELSRWNFIISHWNVNYLNSKCFTNDLVCTLALNACDYDPNSRYLIFQRDDASNYCWIHSTGVITSEVRVTQGLLSRNNFKTRRWVPPANNEGPPQATSSYIPSPSSVGTNRVWHLAKTGGATKFSGPEFETKLQMIHAL